MKEVDRDARGSQNSSRVPTVRSPTPSLQDAPSRFQSPELKGHEIVIAAWSPAPSRYGVQSPPGHIPQPSAATPYSSASFVVDMPASVVQPGPPSPPPSPPPPPCAPVKWRVVDPGRDALLASIQVGEKLKKVRDADKNARAARKDEAQVEGITTQTPMYHETSHSRDVEALEHAQAVEERERQWEEVLLSRTKTPFIAPQPRPKLAVNLQDKLAAKLGTIRLSKPSIEGSIRIWTKRAIERRQTSCFQ
jgi:hypothetical protein